MEFIGAEMKRMVIFYFSGTGNTWWVSERIVQTLNGMGTEASAHSIEQVSMEETAALISEADAVGFGFPIYGSDAPRNFLHFLQALPQQTQDKDTFGFVTQLGWSGDGFNFLRGMMEKKGYRLKWATEFNMPNNIALSFFPFPYSADYERFTRQLQKCEQKIGRVCQKIAAEEGWREHSDLFSAASAWIQRGPFRQAHDWGRKYWSVDAEACIGCERCLRICPVSNIRMEEGVAVHGGECVYCMRCYNYCPTLAIHYFGASNKRAERNPPFKGPVKDFKPELICKQGE
jgi:ferredoxin/flavodoxin